MITTAELRKKFIDFFKEKQHSHQPSSSLVPFGDDTLLFTNAGMVQFKDVFLGVEKRDFSRAVTVQKCLRAGGKHNDLDNVGYTARHHTFFEMLGNFSFGDYFKKEAINFAWQFLTEVINLPKDKLWVTIYTTDDQSFNIWHKDIGLAKERIIRIDSKDNFWEMGDTGPCGPCTEIFYDHGENIPGGLPGTPEEDGDRYIEIWNIVFMQYSRQANGELLDLPKPSVDTGMGIERLAAVLQHVNSNYEIDLFQDLIKEVARVIKTNNLDSPSLKVVADHIRSCSFLIADGVLPSNEGRGYVLRRIIRRAVRHGNKLGAQEIFFYKIVNKLISLMGDAYPELKENKDLIEKTLKKEEEQFIKTIENGLKIFETEVANLKGNIISGELVFKLYDTYGFPADLTADMAREKDLQIDYVAFEKEMSKQKERSKQAGKFKVDYNKTLKADTVTEFRGYSSLSEDAKVVEIFENGIKIEQISASDEEIVIVLDKTPFYAESGGQVADTGVLEGVGVKFEIYDVQKSGSAFLHIGKLRAGSLHQNDEVTARVEGLKRLDTAANHSATHLLHSALKKVIGNHAEQKGSLVDENKLRFDYSHDKPLTKQEIRKLEHLVNTVIRANYIVETMETTPEKAKQMGAQALFGEKYGDIVRVVCMDDFSIELCGGTHVRQTGDIGLFKIVSDSGIAAGVRRIEAITGTKANHYIIEMEDILDFIKSELKATNTNILDKLSSLQEKLKLQEKQIAKLKKDLLSGSNSAIAEKEHNGVTVVTAVLEDVDVKTLREKVDDYKAKKENIIVVLATVINEKIQFVIGVSKNMITSIKAGDIAKNLSSMIDGKGGGRPDMAQGGGTNLDNLDNAITKVQELILNAIS